MPSSRITSIASGRTRLGFVPAQPLGHLTASRIACAKDQDSCWLFHDYLRNLSIFGPQLNLEYLFLAALRMRDQDGGSVFGE